MNINVTGDPVKDSYMIMMQSKRIETICETLKKHIAVNNDVSDFDDIRLILNLELALLDIKECAKSIYDQSGEHS